MLVVFSLLPVSGFSMDGGHDISGHGAVVALNGIDSESDHASCLDVAACLGCAFIGDLRSPLVDTRSRGFAAVISDEVPKMLTPSVLIQPPRHVA